MLTCPIDDSECVPIVLEISDSRDARNIRERIRSMWLNTMQNGKARIKKLLANTTHSITLKIVLPYAQEAPRFFVNEERPILNTRCQLFYGTVYVSSTQAVVPE